MRRGPILRSILALMIVAVVFFVFLYVITPVVGKGGGFGSKARIAVVSIDGPFFDSKEIVRQIREYGEDASIRGLVLRINSPGGGVAAAQEVYEAVRRFRFQGRKVVASMASVAASGGYYVAVAADRIVANPGSITGSIGVVMQFANVEPLIKKVGMKTVVLKSGRHKDIGSPLREMTEEERRLLQGVIDDVYEQFVEVVSSGRGLSVEQVKVFADGRIFSGRQAKVMGLVDELGDLQDAIDALTKLARIAGKPEVVQKEKREGLLWRLIRGERVEHLLSRWLTTADLQLQYLWSY